MSLHGAFAVLFFQFLQHGGTRAFRVAVVGGEDLLNLGLQPFALEEVSHLVDEFEVVDASHGGAVGHVLAVGLLKVVQREDLYLIFSEIQFFHVRVVLTV